MQIIICCRCKMEFGMPDEFYRMAVQMKESLSFYCPAGHKQHFPSGESETDKLRRELNRAKQDNAYWRDMADAERKEREAAERSASARKGAIMWMKKRAAVGVC